MLGTLKDIKIEGEATEEICMALNVSETNL